MNNKQTGKIGEAIATKYFKKQGYKIIETNFSCKLGEIDIIVFKKNCLVFVEVKSRSSLKFGSPAEAVTLFKQNHIKNTAQYWLLQNSKFTGDIRFDVVEVLNEEILSHIENAF